MNKIQSLFKKADKPNHKTNIHDCAFCWCDSCAWLETCQQRRACASNVVRDIRPMPCIGCYDGRQFMPKDMRRCRNYTDMRRCRNYTARETQPESQSGM